MRNVVRKTVIYVLTCILAPSAVGYVTGYMTGYSEINKDVLTVVLPALVSLSGLILISGIRANATTESRVMASAGVFVLCVALFVGLTIGVESQQYDNRFISRFLEIKKRENILKACFHSQNELNKVRASLEQKPVSLGEVCP